MKYTTALAKPLNRPLTLQGWFTNNSSSLKQAGKRFKSTIRYEAVYINGDALL